jgi:hypothetical protein
LKGHLGHSGEGRNEEEEVEEGEAGLGERDQSSNFDGFGSTLMMDS